MAETGNNGTKSMVLTAAVTMMGGLVVSAVLALFVLWRDFSVVSERQVQVLKRLEHIEDTTNRNSNMNLEQQYQINQCLERLRPIERMLRREDYP